MKKQKVVRTYPSGYNISTENLEKCLDQGWYVVLSNVLILNKDRQQAIEYILEKDE